MSQFWWSFLFFIQSNNFIFHISFHLMKKTTKAKKVVSIAIAMAVIWNDFIDPHFTPHKNMNSIKIWAIWQSNESHWKIYDIQQMSLYNINNNKNNTFMKGIKMSAQEWMYENIREFSEWTLKTNRQDT